jgi:glutathione synthase/RimK-type ligase-like ATP-grasp enzyme
MKQTDVTFIKGPPQRLNELYCSQEQLNEFQWRNLDLVLLQFGAIRKNVRVVLTPRYEKGKLYCSADVFNDLLLPDSQVLPIHFEPKKRHLLIGPVVGVLANVHWKQTTGVRGEQEKVFRKLLELAQYEHVFAYVFSPLEVQWSKSTVWGYRYQKNKTANGRWERIQLPLPDVVYNQISTRKFEKQNNVREATERLQKMMASRYFNEGYFNKWQVHEWLQQESTASLYIPESARMGDATTVSTLLNRYGNVYLKPIHGSLGIGIIKLSRLSDGRILYQVKQRKSMIQGYAEGVTQALKAVNKGKGSRYMIQRGLHLLTYRGRPFDLRVLIQKDGEGKWNRTKMFARIAKEGDITSNLTTGGDAKPVRVLLQEIIANQKKVNQILKDIRSCIKVIPTAMEKQSDSMLGEIGLDLGIDSNGRVWVIEVNAKPWKKTETEQGDPALVELSFRKPMAYARFLGLSILESST